MSLTVGQYNRARGKLKNSLKVIESLKEELDFCEMQTGELEVIQDQIIEKLAELDDLEFLQTINNLKPNAKIEYISKKPKIMILR